MKERKHSKEIQETSSFPHQDNFNQKQKSHDEKYPKVEKT
jgi:hypothetical protein